MSSSDFEQYLASNRAFFGRRGSFSRAQGTLFVDPSSSDPVILNATLRLAAAISELKGLRPLVVLPRRDSRTNRRIIESFPGMQWISTERILLRGLLSNPLALVRCWKWLTSGKRLVRLRVGRHPIGKHIYDALLRRRGLPTIARLSSALRIQALAEVAFYLALVRTFSSANPPSFGLLGDNTYRSGISFELLRVADIPAIVGLSLTGLQAHIYRSSPDYHRHCRTPDESLVAKALSTPAFMRQADAMLDIRTAGKELQHDTLRAYDPEKANPTRNEVRQRFDVAEHQKLIVVMSHVLQDAPHAYPGTRFDDYHDWLLATCSTLSRNPRVKVVVKEHPSVELFGEEGVLDRVLAELGETSIAVVRDLNTRSFHQAADVVVTCGGTVGLEFPCYGVPVVIAARPPYCDFPYMIVSRSRKDYLETLKRIEEIRPLTPDQISTARAVFYVSQAMMRIPKEEFGLGTQATNLGATADPRIMWREMKTENKSGLGHAKLVDYLARVLSSDYTNFVDPSLLDEAHPAKCTQ